LEPGDHSSRRTFRIDEVPPGSALLVGECAVFSIEGGFCGTQAMCTSSRAVDRVCDWNLDASDLTIDSHAIGTRDPVCQRAICTKHRGASGHVPSAVLSSVCYILPIAMVIQMRP